MGMNSGSDKMSPPTDVAPEGHVMNGDKELDREQIEEAFRVMGQYLPDRNALGRFPRAA
jgi:hypothetical protein